MTYGRATLFFLLLLLVPFAAGLCSKADTESYLAEGTRYSFTPKPVDYAIVIDRSGSMQGQKMETVKIAADDLVGKMQPTDRAAVISFHYEAQLHSSLTNDHKQLQASIESIQAGFSTKYAPPLHLAQQELNSSHNKKAIIFLSDGKSDFAESPEEILNITEQLASQDVCILTISYALGGEENPLLTAMADVGAKHGCGDHFIASEKGTELGDVFSKIYDTISSTDAIRAQPAFSDTNYSFTFVSTINNKPIPGTSGSACIDEPSFRLSVFSDGKLLRTYTRAAGTLSLPPGNYTYKATAAVHCDGACSFVGNAAGNFSIGGACSPGYQELATYVTGETQKVLISASGFSPQSVSGRQGTLVVWQNVDAVPHRLSSEFFNVTVAPGETFTYVIQNIGALVYTDPDRNITASVSPQQGIGNDILLIIDESGSMQGAGIAEARVSAGKFFSLLSPSDRGALITFSENAYLVQDFTSDRSQLSASVDGIRAEGATSYIAALKLAETLRPTQSTIVIFMSDGVPTDSTEQEILAATQRLQQRGWCVMTVGFGEQGEAAHTLLARMAGENDCGAFLYASGGDLSKVFGTVYQLSKSQHDLTFTNLAIPAFTLQRQVAIQTTIVGKTGKPVPGASGGLCAPEATVQSRTSIDTTTLLYEGDAYKGTVQLRPGLNTVSLVASVSASDEAGRVFVGSASARVFYVPVIALVITVLLAGIVIYLVFFRRHYGAS